MKFNLVVISLVTLISGLTNAEEVAPEKSREQITAERAKAKTDEENQFGQILKNAEGLKWGTNYDPQK